MKIKPETIEAQIRAGYRKDNPLVCEKCSAVTRKRDPGMNGCFVYCARFFCRRHHFYVHSQGYCPSFGTGPFVEVKEKNTPYKQEMLFK